MWLIIISIIISLCTYFWLLKPHSFWRNKGVVYVKPRIFFGNIAASLTGRKAFAEVVQDLYNEFPDQRYVGIYQLLLPTLLVRDPELIKRITVKEFETFPEHRTFISEDADPLWGKSLFAMTGGDRWHDMRATLSPAFTSNKMRSMFSLMTDCAKKFVDHFLDQGDAVITVDVKDAFTRYANDVIATTAFGVSVDSLKNRDNDFYMRGKDVSNLTGLKMLKFFGYSLSPTLMKIFRVGLFGEKTSAFFRNLVEESIKIREEHEIIRPDMIHLLMEARKGRLKHEHPKDAAVDKGFAVVEESSIGLEERRQKTDISDDDITAQALLFFMAGFDSGSTLLCQLAYELAVNFDVQEKLILEVDSVHQECKGEVSYEALLGMKYLDMVVSETLRKWPPASIIDRRSTRPCIIQAERADEETLYLETGTVCWIPIYAIHRDPKNYPDPEKFDPERFSDKNKDKIRPYSFIPFGAGPRNCIGSRFALLETKALLFCILTHFEIVPVTKSKIPQVLRKNTFMVVADNTWFGFKRRHK